MRVWGVGGTVWAQSAVEEGLAHTLGEGGGEQGDGGRPEGVQRAGFEAASARLVPLCGHGFQL